MLVRQRGDGTLTVATQLVAALIGVAVGVGVLVEAVEQNCAGAGVIEFRGDG